MRKWFNLFFCCQCILVYGQWEDRLDQIVASYPPETEIGISVINAKGDKLYVKNDTKNIIPASLQKIITNFAILDKLGEDYQFKTTIGYTGEILADGNLTGDIVIFGNGDPSLASERFQKRKQIKDLLSEITKAITAAGINCIDGKIVADASHFGSDGTVHSWSWNDIGNYYAANTWSINIHENYYNLYFQLQSDPNKQPQIIRHQPQIPGLYFENELRTGPPGSGDQSYIFGSPYTYHRVIRGSLPQGVRTFRIKGSIPNSPLYLAERISISLREKGINSQGAAVRFRKKSYELKEIIVFDSPTLSELVQSANLESINLYCEAFLLAMGEGQRSKGIHEVKQFLNEQDIDTTAIFIDDGSGLSFWNHLSPSDFTKLLAELHLSYGQQLKRYFPEAGKSGTLHYMFKDKAAKGNLWAKTGSMQQVMNYAGFTKTTSGEMLYFCITANRHQVSNRKVRAIHEQLMNAIYLKK